MPMKKKSGAGKGGWRGRRLRQAGQSPLRTRASQDATRQTIRAGCSLRAKELPDWFAWSLRQEPLLIEIAGGIHVLGRK